MQPDVMTGRVLLNLLHACIVACRLWYCFGISAFCTFITGLSHKHAFLRHDLGANPCRGYAISECILRQVQVGQVCANHSCLQQTKDNRSQARSMKLRLHSDPPHRVTVLLYRACTACQPYQSRGTQRTKPLALKQYVLLTFVHEEADA